MFVLGKAQLVDRPSVAQGLMHRFPCVIVDEMQDTSAMQNKYLSAIFPRDNPGICVTRVGTLDKCKRETVRNRMAGKRGGGK
ncbi:UvrD-helicase domain-containing protein [Pseudomonas koreensis]|uniref:UvrD-helicase domain-containing protein n=1 Tax=Pseudomonas koreensis TaxID=198620 RepID=UPI0034A021DE